PAAAVAKKTSTSSKGQGESARADAAVSVLSEEAAGMSNPQLMRWMFRFLAPVKPLVFLACFYLTAFVAIEQLAVRQTGQAIDHIQHLSVRREIAQTGFWHWLWRGPGEAQTLHARGLLWSLVHHNPTAP